MAYGLDVKDLIYTDAKLYDIGTLDDYTVDIDLAKEKNFELEVGASADFQRKIRKTIGGKIDLSNDISQLDLLIPIHGYWYIEGTEFGGVVDQYKTDNDNYSIKYLGRSWRGILDSKIFVADNLKTQGLSGRIEEVISTVLTDYELDYLFECEKLDDDEFENVNFDVDYTAAHGDTIYNVLQGLAEDINMTLVFRYKHKYSKVFITPTFANDYTEEMTYDVDSSVNFSVEQNFAFVNHYILTSKDDNTDERYMIHLFRDNNDLATIVPYTTVDIAEVIKDDQYILDKSGQKMFGTDEICEYVESQNSVITNHEKLEEEPADWKDNYKSYFKRKPEVDPDTGETTGESWSAVEPVLVEDYIRLSDKPPDWDVGYDQYYTKSWSMGRTKIDCVDVYMAYTQVDAYIRSSGTAYGADWLSLTQDGPPLTPIANTAYNIRTRDSSLYGSSYKWDAAESKYKGLTFTRDWLSTTENGLPLTPEKHKVYVIRTFNDYYSVSYEWNDETDLEEPNRYVESAKEAQDPKWTYSPVSGEQGAITQWGELVSEKPDDWDVTYTNYYYKKTTAEGAVIRADQMHQYQPVPVERIDQMTTWPSAELWAEIYSSYSYRLDNGVLGYVYEQYTGVPADPSDSSQYTQVTVEPPDWGELYDKYYRYSRRNDGRQWINSYEPYSMVNEQTHKKVLRKPSDWEDVYDEYFKRVPRVKDPKNPEADYDWQQILGKSEASGVDNQKAYKKVKGSEIPNAKYWKDHYDEYYRYTKVPYKVKGKNGGYVAKFESYASQREKGIKYGLVTKEPADWKTNYDDYYYAFQNGNKIEYRQYESLGGGSRYVRMTNKPTDWASNYSSYYKKVTVTKERTVNGKKVKVKTKSYASVEPKKKNGKKVAPSWNGTTYYKTVSRNSKPPHFGKLPSDDKTKVKTYIVYKEATEVPPTMDKNNLWVKNDDEAAKRADAPSWNSVKDNCWMLSESERIPDFDPSNAWYFNGSANDKPPAILSLGDGTPNIFYINSVDSVPEFLQGNTYLPVQDTHAPAFVANMYYKKLEKYEAPPFNSAVFYREVFDHYKNMVDEILRRIKEEKSGDSQKVTLDDYDFNIGDLVGGKDHITGLYITRPITNIVVKIDKGEVYIDYSMDDESELSISDTNEEQDEPDEET